MRANYIQIAPEVAGRLAELPVKDNQVVRKGDLLFQIDPRSYQYALGVAESERDQLEQQIIDQVRHIASQRSAAAAADAYVQQANQSVRTASSGVEVASANIRRAEATVARELASLRLAKDTLDRIAPLLARHFVTVQQVDDANTSVRLDEARYNEALAERETARNQLLQLENKRRESEAETLASAAKLQQAVHNVDTTEMLRSQRLGKLFRVESARVDLERCQVKSPFDALVTNMNISQGAYAHVGTPMFTLIDMRTWYIIANYRESKLKQHSSWRPSRHLSHGSTRSPISRLCREYWQRRGPGGWEDRRRTTRCFPNAELGSSGGAVPGPHSRSGSRAGLIPHRRERRHDCARMSGHRLHSLFALVTQDLRPTPGRLRQALRVTLATLVTLVVVMTFRLPAAVIALYFVLVISRDNPMQSLRWTGMIAASICISLALVCGVVTLSENDPRHSSGKRSGSHLHRRHSRLRR